MKECNAMAGFYLGIAVAGLNALVAMSLVLAFMSPMTTHWLVRISTGIPTVWPRSYHPPIREATKFQCPTCGAHYKVVRIEAAPMHDRQIVCVSVAVARYSADRASSCWNTSAPMAVGKPFF